MILTTPEHGSHFYTINGEPCYEVPNKSKPDEMRKATIADAKKNGWLPSPTTVQKEILANETISTYRVNQALMHAFTTPHLENETGDKFARRVINSMESDRDDILNAGNAIHKLAENYISGYPYNVDNICQGYFEDWLDNQEFCGDCEKVLVNKDDMYAGRVDFVGGFNDVFSIVDFKSQNVKTKPTFYPEWLYQLGAYFGAVGCVGKLYSVVISTNKDNLGVWVKEYTDKEALAGLQTFLQLRKLYKMIKGV